MEKFIRIEYSDKIRIKQRVDGKSYYDWIPAVRFF